MKNYEITLVLSNPDQEIVVNVAANESGEAANKATKWLRANRADLESSSIEGWTAMDLPFPGKDQIS